MHVLKAIFALVVGVVLVIGAMEMGERAGLSQWASSWLAAALIVGIIVALDPANRRG